MKYRALENIKGRQMVNVSDIVKEVEKRTVLKQDDLHGWVAYHLIELQILVIWNYFFLNTQIN